MRGSTVMLVLCMAFVLTTVALTPVAAQPFFEDFDAGLDPLIWRVETVSGATWYHGTEEGNGYVYATTHTYYNDRFTDLLTQRTDFSDFTMTWDMRLRSNTGHGPIRSIYLRGGDFPHVFGYWLVLRSEYNTAYLQRLNPGLTWTTFEPVIPQNIPLHEWTSFKIVVVYNNFKFKFWPKGSPEPSEWAFDITDTVTDPPPPSSGSVGFGNYWQSLTDVDNVRVTPDSDGDGISDPVDGEFVGGAFVDESTVPSDNFTDQHLGGTSFGYISKRIAGLVVAVTDGANPEGLRIVATGGPGNARVKSCGNPQPIKLTSGDEILITCSELTVRVLMGPVEIELSEEAIIIVPTGATVTVTELGGEQFEIENSSPAGTPPVLIAIRDETIVLAPGESFAVRLVSPVLMDIKPGSCPNPLNIKMFQNQPPNANPKKGGVLPVAILGSSSFDVNDIDVSSLLLEGVAPLRHDYEDVAAPVEDGEECECTTAGPDGFEDLTLKFSKSEIAAVLGFVSDGDTIALTLTGELLDGTPFEASDCVRIGSKEPVIPDIQGPNQVVVIPATPNPFNPVTRIGYVLPTGMDVTLTVYDVNGRVVERLVSGFQTGGEHFVEWKATGIASGVYFYRLQTRGFTETRRMILLK